MITRIRKWGNSLGLRIPRSFAREAHVGPGAEVDVSVQRGRLVVRVVKGRKYTLKDMLDGITPDNLHKEIDFGKPMGRELL